MRYTQHTNHRSAGFGVDTCLVLFFLALEIGRSIELLSIDGLLMSITLMMVLVLPYFLPSRGERPSMTSWLTVRGTVTITALVLGLVFGRGATASPVGYRTIPMTFLILSSMVSAYIQFYGLMRLRPVK